MWTFFPSSRVIAFSSDGYYYINVAFNVLKGNGLIDSDGSRVLREPLFFYYLTLCFRLFGASFLTAYVAIRIFWLPTLLMVYLLAKKLTTPFVGVITLLLIVTSTALNFWATLIHLDTIISFFLLLTLYLVVKAMSENRYRLFGLAGIIFGLAFLFKTPNALALLPVLCLFALSDVRNPKNWGRWSWFILGAFILIIPWQLYLSGVAPRGLEKITSVVSTSNSLKQSTSFSAFLDVFILYYREELSPAFLIAPFFLVASIYLILKGITRQENRLLLGLIIGYLPFVFLLKVDDQRMRQGQIVVFVLYIALSLFLCDGGIWAQKQLPLKTPAFVKKITLAIFILPVLWFQLMGKIPSVESFGRSNDMSQFFTEHNLIDSIRSSNSWHMADNNPELFDAIRQYVPTGTTIFSSAFLSNALARSAFFPLDGQYKFVSARTYFFPNNTTPLDKTDIVIIDKGFTFNIPFGVPRDLIAGVISESDIIAPFKSKASQYVVEPDPSMQVYFLLNPSFKLIVVSDQVYIFQLIDTPASISPILPLIGPIAKEAVKKLQQNGNEKSQGILDSFWGILGWQPDYGTKLIKSEDTDKPKTGLKGYIERLERSGPDSFNVAIHKYEKSIKIYPENSWSYIILGQIHFALGQLKNNDPANFENAKIYYATAFQYAKEQPYAVLAIAQGYNELNRFDKAYVDSGTFNEAMAMLKTISINSQSTTLLSDIAQFYNSLGKTQEALSLYNRLIELNPNDNVTYRAIVETYANVYAKVYLKQGEYEEVLKLYNDVIDRFPERDEALQTSIGRLYLNAKQYQLAETTFKNIIADFPTDNRGYSWLGRVYEQQSMWKEAISTYELGLTNTLDDELFFQSLGVLYEKLGSDYLQSTIQLYNKAIERSPYNRFFYLHLFDVFLKNRQFSEAMDLYQTLLKNIPSDYRFHLGIAKLAFGIDNELAIQAYSTAIELSPKDDFAYQQLIPIYEQNGDLEKLGELYKKGLEYLPNQQKLYTLHLAELYYSQKLYDDAVVFYLKLLEDKDASLEQFIIVEGIYADKEMFDEAATIVQDGLKRFPYSDQLNFIFGQLMDKQDRPKEALKAYQKAIKLNPLVDERAYKRIGELLIKQKDPESALKVYEQGLDSFPDSYGLTINLGDVLVLMNKESEGENAYKKALEIQLVSGVAYLRLGKLYEKQKRIDEAISIYKEGLKNVKQQANRQNIQKQLDKLLSADTTP